MPLITDNILEARGAYAALELRAQSAQQSVAALQSTVEQLSSVHQSLVESATIQNQFAVGQVQTNAQLTAQQAGQVSPDISLESFIASLGLAVALGEASVPDRTINSVTATVQSYFTLDIGTDGVPTAGLRLYQPELGAPTALATISFEIAKVTPKPGTPAPRTLYIVLQYKQSVFADSFWAKFTTGTPPSHPAALIVAEMVKMLANVGGWNLPYLVQEAAIVAGLETSLATLVGAASPSAQASAYANAAGALSTLTKSLDPATRSNFVAGDLFALVAALDATTNIADSLRS